MKIKVKFLLLCFSKIEVLSDSGKEVIKADKLHPPFSGCHTVRNVQVFDCSGK